MKGDRAFLAPTRSSNVGYALRAREKTVAPYPASAYIGGPVFVPWHIEAAYEVGNALNIVFKNGDHYSFGPRLIRQLQKEAGEGNERAQIILSEIAKWRLTKS